MDVRLETEYNYYTSHKKELLDKYLEKYIVIKDTAVVGVYTSQDEALTESSQKYKMGTFLIQQVMQNDEAIQRFYSRVYV